MAVDYLIVSVISALSSVAVVIIVSLGLAIIFGLMRVVNLAHGEFIMIGAYSTLTAYTLGIPFIVAVFVAAGVNFLLGVIIERVIIRRLYNRLLDTLLVTWGLGLVLYQGIVYIFGTTSTAAGVSFGIFRIGGYSIGAYSVYLIGIAVLVATVVYLILVHTNYGILARASAQDADTAAAMGVDSRKINTITFGFGAALAGLAGGILLPIVPVTPGMGISFVIKAFLTVIAAGPMALTGTIMASGILGSLSAFGSSYWFAAAGDIVFFIGAVLCLYLFPRGLTGKLMKRI